MTAVNECGQGPPSEPSEPFTPIAPTSEVTSFRLGKITDESIELLWRQPAEVGAAGIQGYLVELQTLPGKMGHAKAEDAKGKCYYEISIFYMLIVRNNYVMDSRNESFID